MSDIYREFLGSFFLWATTTLTTALRDACGVLLQAMQSERHFLHELERKEIQDGYLNRIYLPTRLSKDSLEAFISSVDERRKERKN